MNSQIDFSNKADVERLVSNCINGDRVSQQEFYKAFYNKMMGICMRYATDTEDAKDLLHDGFIKIFNKLKGFKNEGSLEGWVRRIMVNNAIDHVRKRKETFVRSDNENLFDSIETDNEDDAENEVLVSIKAELLLKLIQQLSPAYRTVFNMYVIENYTHKEIAQILGINIGTSKSNLAKAKMKLRESYKKYENKLDR
ncbi:MAG: RNA polymerase sigma factor [Bacteroidia bacterium]|nr:RNA polymerase sigma factor [Bacteroidia bacterium]